MTTDRLEGRKTLKVEGFLEEFEKDEIKAHVDIVSLFSSFGVKLTSKGKGFIGKCPWHDDKEPSLSVDREKGLYHCFGCGESGDAVSFVEKMKGAGFREALAYLKEHATSLGMPLKGSRVVREAAGRRMPYPSAALPTAPSAELRFILDDVAARYASELAAHPEARAYLASRGLDIPELITTFRLGFSSGKLAGLLSAAHKAELERLGILKGTRGEHFKGCIVVPLFDEAGHVAGFYGRRITSNSGPAHLYPPGPHRGLFNRDAAKVYREETILAESAIDALSLIAIGIPNAIACYGVNGFTEEHSRLLNEERVKTVVIAFDNDQAGAKGAEKLMEILLAQGITVKTVTPLGAKDWNEALVAGVLSKEAVRKLIESAPLEKPKENEHNEPFRMTAEGNRYLFTAQEIRYRVIGVKDIFVSSLRVNVRAEYAGLKAIDNVDLYAARSRAAFAMSLAGLFAVEPTRIERDLLKMIDSLEAERDKKLSLTDPSPKPMSEEEKALGLSLLEDPDIFTRIESDMSELGYVNEEANKKLVYLAAVSRLLPQPLNVYIQAGASGGKSALLSTLERLLPPESVIKAFTISPQAFHYVAEDGFLSKVFIMGEAIHDEDIEAMVRQMQSEGELSRLVTLKDPKSGEYKARLLKKPVKMSFMVTSTALELHPENSSRCMILTVDESPAQTEEVQKWMGKKRIVQARGEDVGAIVSRHHAAQRLLEPIAISNPLAPLIKFPKERPTMRRAFEQFLTLMDAVCFLRQKQKQVRLWRSPLAGKDERYIECDLEDYRVAYRLFREGVFKANAADIPAGTRRLFELIRQMLKEMSEEQGIAVTEVSFIQKDLREYTRLGAEFIKKHLRFLVDYEYLQLVGGKLHGTRFSYRLRQDGPLEDMDADSMSTPEELQEEFSNAR